MMLQINLSPLALKPPPTPATGWIYPRISFVSVFLMKKMLKPPPTTSATNTPPGVATCQFTERGPPGSGGLGFGGSTWVGGGGGGVGERKM
jgi:hypothetical protein